MVKTWLCVTPERMEKTSRIMEALNAGGHGEIRLGAPRRMTDPFVVWGHCWLAERIVPHAQATGIDWWLVDNGFYLPAGHHGNGYYSITYRGTAPALLADADRSRLPVTFPPWRTDGSYVLLALPGDGHGRMLGLDMPAWCRTIESRIRAHTDRPITRRAKGCGRPLERDLAGAFVLVTHSSKVAVDAIRAGVPCIVEPANPAAPVAGTDLADIENPPRPDGREEWWSSLMAQQFTLAEMRAGKAREVIR